MNISKIHLLLFFLCSLSLGTLFGQKFIEPDKQKQFNITVNYEDYTVKTQMLSQPKDVCVKNDRTYLWYASQKIMETKGGYDGKLIHGKYNSFYLNNQLKEQGQIKYGLKNKQWKYWYPDGKLKEIIYWRNGVKDGQYELYNDYGNIMARSRFKNDKLHGKFYTYGPAGNVIEKKRYKNGEEVRPKVRTKTTKTKKIKEEKKSEPKTKRNRLKNLFKKKEKKQLPGPEKEKKTVSL